MSYVDQTKINLFHLSANRSFVIETNENSDSILSNILHGGNHLDDFHRRRVSACRIHYEEMLCVTHTKD